MTQLTPEERERVLDEMRKEMRDTIMLRFRCRAPLSMLCANKDRRGIRKLIRRIRALDQLRAESGLIEKLERMMRAPEYWRPIMYGGSFLLQAEYGPRRGETADGNCYPTLTAALKSAPEPER